MCLFDCGMDYVDVVVLYVCMLVGELWDVVVEVLVDVQFVCVIEVVDVGYFVMVVDVQVMVIVVLLFVQMVFNYDVLCKCVLYVWFVDVLYGFVCWFDKWIECVEVLFGDVCLIGWLVCLMMEFICGIVIVFGGQSGWGFVYWLIVYVFVVCGVVMLFVEGFGQGEMWFEQWIFVDVDMIVVYWCFVDYVVECVFGLIGIWGNSIGGLWVVLIVVVDEWIVVCCVNGVFVVFMLLLFCMFVEQVVVMFGNDDFEVVLVNFVCMCFLFECDCIVCLLLVLYGGVDLLIWFDDQQLFFDVVMFGDVMFRVWLDGEYMIYNYVFECIVFVCDWFVEWFVWV